MVFAKQILAIPASPTSSERLFSFAGLFDTVKRVNLKLETLETLTLLKSNKKLFEETLMDVEKESDEEESDHNQDESEEDMTDTDEDDEQIENGANPRGE